MSWTCSGSLCPLLVNLLTKLSLHLPCQGVAIALSAALAPTQGTFLCSKAWLFNALAKILVLEKLWALDARKRSLPCWWIFSTTLLSPKFLATLSCSFIAKLLAVLKFFCNSSCSKAIKRHLTKGLFLQKMEARGLTSAPPFSADSAAKMILKCLTAKLCASLATKGSGESKWW